jgi:F0F1-type ATP synthase membrane subunit c/vacuolar-type H+-ATPase subunit K
MEHPKGTQVLVLGIVSLVCCYPLGIAALIIGGNARKEIAANPGVRYTNQTQITVGWVLGIVATVVFVIGLVYGASTL